MEVRPGYKDTEVGVIPEEWDVTSLGELAELTSSKRIFESDYVSSGIPFFRGKEISLLIEGKPIDDAYFITEKKFDELKAQFGAPERGDILITAVGTLANVFIVGNEVPFYFKDGNLIWLRKLKGTNPEYLGVQLRTRRSDIINGAIGTSQKALTIVVLRNLLVSCPPLPEQHAISNALSDMDALVRALEGLIAKKRELKQAAMQQLLTGQTRLPGFSGEWEEKTLGELFDFSGGYSASREQLSTEGHFYLHYGDIHGAMKTFVDTQVDYLEIPKLDIPLKRVSPSSMLNDGDVVFVDASEDDAGTSKHVVVVNKDNLPFIAGLHTIVAKSRTEELDHQYRRYCFQTKAIRQQFLFYAVGTKVSGISKTNIPKLTLPVPSTTEQVAIATMLEDMDAELAALELQLAKTRDLKQAMMQELLTGRIRLLTPEARHA